MSTKKKRKNKPAPKKEKIVVKDLTEDTETKDSASESQIKSDGQTDTTKHKGKDSSTKIKADEASLLPQKLTKTIEIAEDIKALTYEQACEIGRAVQQECRDRSRMPSSA
eukprot:TRINITY_DN94721_c0_g1_i1.p1 TRINITY_DN94721_c0_g1~~TRINITY_DN94721_c0_g1_i1.p1  ORF type:complete len:110 (+),score=14.99 TRINITY_DN94721_c0_g1_i1:24-353(+)